MPSRKKIGPGQWDVSIAEHLAPGETYPQVSQGLLHFEAFDHPRIHAANCQPTLFCRLQLEASRKSLALTAP